MKEKWFAKARDRRWLALFLPMTAILWLFIGGCSKILLDFRVSSLDAGIWLLMSFVASFAVCGFAYANLKIAFGFSAAGVIVGLAFMAYVFTRPIAAAGLVGLVSGAQVAFLFLIVGINIEMLRHISMRRRKQNGY